MDRFCVSFQYHIGQEVYFLYKNYPKRGIIREVNISIKDIEDIRIGNDKNFTG